MTLVDKLSKRPAQPRYYLSESAERIWAVVDRSIDLPVTRDYKTKTAAIRAFLKQISEQPYA
jgi:hypothetical protein